MSTVLIRPRRYRKRPVVVEALPVPAGPLDGTERRAAELGALIGFLGTGTWEINDGLGITIHTLEDDMVANPGDFVIRGVKGEFYPCKPDIFEQSYEVAT